MSLKGKPYHFFEIMPVPKSSGDAFDGLNF
jgi:hypothetical protein